MSALGSRSAATDGCCSPASRSETVSVRGRRVGRRSPPTSRCVRSRRRCPRRGARPVRGAPAIVAQASATSSSSYCRSTLKARTTAGRRPPATGTSNPPRANDTRGVRRERRSTGPHLLELLAGARHAGRVDLEAEHLDVRADAGQARVQLQRGDAARAVAEVDHERVRGPAEGGLPRDPAIHAPQPVGAGRAARDLPDRSPRHPPMMPGRRHRRADGSRPPTRRRGGVVARISWGA